MVPSIVEKHSTKNKIEEFISKSSLKIKISRSSSHLIRRKFSKGKLMESETEYKTNYEFREIKKRRRKKKKNKHVSKNINRTHRFNEQSEKIKNKQLNCCNSKLASLRCGEKFNSNRNLDHNVNCSDSSNEEITNKINYPGKKTRIFEGYNTGSKYDVRNLRIPAKSSFESGDFLENLFNVEDQKNEYNTGACDAVKQSKSSEELHSKLLIDKLRKLQYTKGTNQNLRKFNVVQRTASVVSKIFDDTRKKISHEMQKVKLQNYWLSRPIVVAFSFKKRDENPSKNDVKNVNWRAKLRKWFENKLKSDAKRNETSTRFEAKHGAEFSAIDNLNKQRKILIAKLRAPKAGASKLYLHKEEYEKMEEQELVRLKQLREHATIPVFRKINYEELNDINLETIDVDDGPKSVESTIKLKSDQLERKKIFDRLQKLAQFSYKIVLSKSQSIMKRVSIDSVDREVKKIDDLPFSARYNMGPNAVHVNVKSPHGNPEFEQGNRYEDEYVECQNSKIKLTLMRGYKFLKHLDPNAAKIIEIDCKNPLSAIKICYGGQEKCECVCDDDHVCENDGVKIKHHSGSLFAKEIMQEALRDMSHERHFVARRILDHIVKKSTRSYSNSTVRAVISDLLTRTIRDVDAGHSKTKNISDSVATTEEAFHDLANLSNTKLKQHSSVLQYFFEHPDDADILLSILDDLFEKVISMIKVEEIRVDSEVESNHSGKLKQTDLFARELLEELLEMVEKNVKAKKIPIHQRGGSVSKNYYLKLLGKHMVSHIFERVSVAIDAASQNKEEDEEIPMSNLKDLHAEVSNDEKDRISQLLSNAIDKARVQISQEKRKNQGNIHDTYRDKATSKEKSKERAKTVKSKDESSTNHVEPKITNTSGLLKVIYKEPSTNQSNLSSQDIPNLENIENISNTNTLGADSWLISMPNSSDEDVTQNHKNIQTTQYKGSENKYGGDSTINYVTTKRQADKFKYNSGKFRRENKEIFRKSTLVLTITHFDVILEIIPEMYTNHITPLSNNIHNGHVTTKLSMMSYYETTSKDSSSSEEDNAEVFKRLEGDVLKSLSKRSNEIDVVDVQNIICRHFRNGGFSKNATEKLLKNYQKRRKKR